jgi:hypothetical protein
MENERLQKRLNDLKAQLRSEPSSDSPVYGQSFMQTSGFSSLQPAPNPWSSMPYNGFSMGSTDALANMPNSAQNTMDNGSLIPAHGGIHSGMTESEPGESTEDDQTKKKKVLESPRWNFRTIDHLFFSTRKHAHRSNTSASLVGALILPSGERLA